MPPINAVETIVPEATAWRRHLHAHPELMYDVHETARFVADKLRSFGCDEVVEGIGRTGVVGIIRGARGDGGPGRTIGLRADMDALPITETTGAEHASTVPGRMHACGHDGHTAMLLGAARHLCDTRNFAGSVAVIFQPAEEGGAGGLAMVRDGMMERFGIEEVYGMHNMPGLPIGSFAIRPGPIMAATDEFTVHVRGRGSHAAQPHRSVDPIVVGAQIVTALQTIASRNADPIGSLVLTVTKFQAGTAYNVIPETALIAGTFRTLDEGVREMAGRRLREVCEGVGAALGATVEVQHHRNYPVTVNHPDETGHAVGAAREVAGEGRVEVSTPPIMGGEDFSYMLEARPGAFIFVGNGDTATLHHPDYDFSDEAIAHGTSYWVRLAERRLAA